jgi:flagellar motor protein MotB
MRSPDKHRTDSISWGFQQAAQGEELPGQDSTWHMSFSDLTLLLLCFLLIGYWSQRKEGEKDGKPIQERAISTEVEPSHDKSDSWTTLGNEMEKYAEALGVGAEVAVASTHRDLVITLRDALLFDSGKADLRGEVLPILEKVTMMAVRQTNFNIEVMGHADNVPIARPEFPSNWELSTARASRVARQLIENGVDPARLSVKGYGDSRPLVPNTTPENRRINRRVEIRLSQDLP